MASTLRLHREMNHELCILFLHHRNDELSRFHYSLFESNNDGVPIVPLTFGSGLPDAVKVGRWHWPVHDEWYSNDVMIYSWFEQKQLAASRYAIFDYDTLCLQSVREFYSEVWDSDVACATPITCQDSGWYWFEPQFGASRELFGNQLAGMTPASGSFFSHEALAAMVNLAKHKLYAPLFCECRLGTLASTAGFSIRRIRDDAASYVTWNDVSPTHRGIWHPVKRILPMEPNCEERHN